ncbi:MAG: sigma-54-dependent Fis family transcriptional regulator [Firmicutes bacterium]|nr:sigma-54-dependent Fis family transcriptional regulator [Bacillota bacterium]
MREPTNLQPRAFPGANGARGPEEGTDPTDPVVGRSPGSIQAFRRALRAAYVNSPVLIIGERGTGRRTLARMIHQRGARRARPFIVLDCQQIQPVAANGNAPFPAREKSTAIRVSWERPGDPFGVSTAMSLKNLDEVLAAAEGGTLFLEEAGLMPFSLQAELARILRARGTRARAGASGLRVADVRLISATELPLGELVAKGRFREDLLDRLGVIQIRIPPLRERREDIPLLARAVLVQEAHRLGKPPLTVSTGAMQALQSYDFPGNIPELREILARAAALKSTGILERQDVCRLLNASCRTSRP